MLISDSKIFKNFLGEDMPLDPPRGSPTRAQSIATPKNFEGGGRGTLPSMQSAPLPQNMFLCHEVLLSQC